MAENNGNDRVPLSRSERVHHHHRVTPAVTRRGVRESGIGSSNDDEVSPRPSGRSERAGSSPVSKSRSKSVGRQKSLWRSSGGRRVSRPLPDSDSDETASPEIDTRKQYRRSNSVGAVSHSGRSNHNVGSEESSEGEKVACQKEKTPELSPNYNSRYDTPPRSTRLSAFAPVERQQVDLTEGEKEADKYIGPFEEQEDSTQYPPRRRGRLPRAKGAQVVGGQPATHQSNKRVAGAARRSSMTDERVAYRGEPGAARGSASDDITPTKPASSVRRTGEAPQFQSYDTTDELLDALAERYGMTTMVELLGLVQEKLGLGAGQAKGNGPPEKTQSAAMKGAVERQLSVFTGGWVGGKTVTQLYGRVTDVENPFVRAGCALLHNDGVDGGTNLSLFKNGMSSFRSYFLSGVRDAVQGMLCTLVDATEMAPTDSVAELLIDLECNISVGHLKANTAATKEFTEKFWRYPMSGHTSPANGEHSDLKRSDVYGDRFDQDFLPVAVSILKGVVRLVEADIEDAKMCGGASTADTDAKAILQYRIRAWAKQLIPEPRSSAETHQKRASATKGESAWVEWLFSSILRLVCARGRPANVLMAMKDTCPNITLDIVTGAVQPYKH